MTDVIWTEGLTKRFGDLVAVDNLNLSVKEGECYAYIGRNGSGKSTTARVLLGFLRPTKGKTRVLGGVGSNPNIRARIGYLPGELNLPKVMTGADAFAYYGSLFVGVKRSELIKLVKRFELDPSRRVHEMSTGNQRKVGIVLAFMHCPELLILDEPTSGLDPIFQAEFRDLLAERKEEGTSIFLTSHIMAEVARVADRVGLLAERGRLVKELTMEQLRNQATDAIRFTFTQAPNLEAFEGVPGVTNIVARDLDVSVSIDGPVGPLLTRAGELGAVDVYTMGKDLDTVFTEIYAEENN